MVSLLLWTFSVSGQMGLDEAIDAAVAHAPIYGTSSISLEETRLKIRNIKMSQRPQLSLNAQATYQSDVTAIDIDLPGVGINPLAKDLRL